MVKFFFSYIIVGGFLVVCVWVGIPRAKNEVYLRMFPAKEAPDQGSMYIAKRVPVNPKKGIQFTATPASVAPATPNATGEGSDSGAATVASATGRQPVTARAPQFTPSWGVIRDTINGFTSAGTLFEKIKGGTVVEQISKHDSNAGMMVKCRVLKDNVWVTDIFIPEGGIAVCKGDYASYPASDRNEILKYYALRNKVAERQMTFREAAIKANPHFTDYQKVAKEAIEFQKKAKDLEEKRNAVEGAQRNLYNDQLRQLKNEEPKLANRFQEIEDRYKLWRDNNDDGSEAAAKDSQIKEWTKELGTMEAAVRSKVVSNW